MLFDDLDFKKNGCNINKRNMLKIRSFINYILSSESNFSIIFRGENYENMKRKFNLNGNQDYHKLNQVLFILGDKGRKYRKEYRDKILNKQKLYSINSVDPCFFKYIFNKTNSLMKRISHPEIQEFAKKNKIFYDFFCNVSNIHIFLDIIENLNKSKKVEVRDYYLRILHIIGQIGFFNNTFFTSTTTDLDVAQTFSTKINDSDSIIIVSWISATSNSSGITFNNFIFTNNYLESLNLPTYSVPFFDSQDEVSIKGGLLPHFILGYIKNKREFIVNPNFFNENQNTKDKAQNGFSVDQSKFHSTLDNTDYESHFIVDSDGKYWDQS